MQTHHPVRVPARAIALFAFWLLACGSTEEYHEPTPYQPAPSYTPPPTSTNNGTANNAPPPATAPVPTFSGYIAEFDRNQAPAYAKKVDVSIATGAPTKPTDDFWTVLSERHGVQKSDNNPNRGNGGDPFISHDFKLGFSGTEVTLSLASESKIIYNADGSSRRVAHGLAFCTWQSSRATMSPNAYYKLSDPYVYALGYFRDGRMNGPWAFNYQDESRNGTQIMRYIAEYGSNQANGEVRFYDKQGYLIEQCWALNGVRHGTSYAWTDTGSVSTAYVGDQQHGLRCEFNTSGQMTRRGNIHGDKFYGKTEFWYPTGTYPYVVRFFDFGANRGWASYYSKDGSLGYQVWIEDGQQTGPWQSYTTTGEVLWKGARQNGKAHGKFQRLHAEGWVDMECEYVENKQTGPIRWLYKDGKTLEEGRMENDLRQGEFKGYREDGTVQWVSVWTDGQLGKTTYYDAQGNVERVEGDPDAARNAPGWTWIDNGEFRANDVEQSALCFDGESGKCLLFGGANLEQAHDLNMSFDGTSWTKLTPRKQAPARADGVMYFDAATKRVRLTGGYAFYDFDDTTNESVRSTWEWDGKGWSLIDDGKAAPATFGRRLSAYDPERKTLVVLGFKEGQARENTKLQTFTFNGSEWASTRAPVLKEVGDARLVWDPSVNKVALWCFPQPDDAGTAPQSWHFDGENWEQSATPMPEAGYSIASVCADAARKGIWAVAKNGLLFFDGKEWVAYETPEMVDFGTQVAVDPKSGRVFLHGCLDEFLEGVNESWWFDPAQGKRK